LFISKIIFLPVAGFVPNGSSPLKILLIILIKVMKLIHSAEFIMRAAGLRRRHEHHS